MSQPFATDPKLDLVFERFVNAPRHLVWQALTQPEHLKQWYMPRPWGVVAYCELDVRPGGIFRIDTGTVEGGESFPNIGCFLEVVPQERLVFTSMLFPGYRPAVFDDIPVTVIARLQSEGDGTRYSFTALHRSEADRDSNSSSGWKEGTEIALDQFVELVESLK